MMLQSSWRISFVTFLRDLSGKDWNTRQDRSMKGFCKKTFSSIATKFQAGVIFICLVLRITSLHCRHAHLLECGFCHCDRSANIVDCMGCRDGAVVRALVSHQCGPGSIPRLGVMCAEFVGSLLCTERFSPGTPVSPLLKNQHLT